MSELKFEITKKLGLLSESAKGWKKEVNMVSWNEREPKLDIREWSVEYDKMAKGITFNKEELKELKRILADIE